MKNRNRNLLCGVVALLLLVAVALFLRFPAQKDADIASADTNSVSERILPEEILTFDYASVPAYGGSAYVAVNGNVPFFVKSDMTVTSFELYSDLDPYGRCGVACACVGKDIMPTEPRGNISSVKPSGWKSIRYDFVDGGSLYNRCHLIAFQLTGENANFRNLITGTRYMNTEGMMPFENMVADYVKEENAHVLYRVTPIFVGEEAVARGVLMEGYSVEDRGQSISYCVFCYNVQPGVEIDYMTGESRLAGGEVTTSGGEAREYVLNTSSMKIHLPSCSAIGAISEHNKKTVTAVRDDLIAQGYQPCGACKP